MDRFNDARGSKGAERDGFVSETEKRHSGSALLDGSTLRVARAKREISMTGAALRRWNNWVKGPRKSQQVQQIAITTWYFWNPRARWASALL